MVGVLTSPGFSAGVRAGGEKKEEQEEEHLWYCASYATAKTTARQGLLAYVRGSFFRHQI